MSKRKAIPESKWKWFGHAGHFVCGQWCRFHMATQVGGYLVSTVGQMVHPSNSAGSERKESEWLAANPNGAEIGCGRFYETMVFAAGKPCSQEGCNCGLPELKSASELDSLGYKLAADAVKGHMEMCKKWSAQ